MTVCNACLAGAAFACMGDHPLLGNLHSNLWLQESIPHQRLVEAVVLLGELGNDVVVVVPSDVVHTKLGKPQKVLIFLLVWHPKI